MVEQQQGIEKESDEVSLGIDSQIKEDFQSPFFGCRTSFIPFKLHLRKPALLQQMSMVHQQI